MLFFKKTQTIAPNEAAGAHARGELVLIDVRDAQERAQARVPGSVHIPLAQLPERLDELPEDRPLAFICASGARSAIAANTAAGNALSAVNVDGGLASWARAGLPVDTGPEGTSHEPQQSRLSTKGDRSCTT